jgi:pilus assembly protein CpaC
MKPSHLLLVLCAAIAVASPARADPSDNTIALGVGSQKVLTVPHVQRVAVGDPAIADVRALEGTQQLLITGASEGRTTLIVWTGPDTRLMYLISVRGGGNDGTIWGGIRRLLGDIEGITVRMVGDRCFLEGLAYTDEDMERLKLVQWVYPDVVNLVKRAPNASKLTAASANAALKKAGFTDAHVVPVGDRLFLEGQVESEADRRRAELIVRAVLDRGQ